MSHKADDAQVHETRAVEEERMEKAVAHVRPGEGSRSLWVLGELVTHKIPSYQTGGAYSLFEVTTQPGAGSPPHVQHREDESFYVLVGDFEFLLNGNTLLAGAGSLLYVPKGTLHAHRNVGEGVGRMLVTQTPGGLYERFFEEVGRPVEGEAGPRFFEKQPDAESIVAAAAKYGIEISPPIVEETQPGNALRGAAL
jgi:mannose-6-phosphate isomerase-like protein (cupin superfamily)